MLDFFRLVQAQFEGDLEAFYILGVLLDESTRPPETLNALNLSQLNRASGVPYETLRRKVAKLQAAGWIVRDGRNYLIAPKARRRLMGVDSALLRLAVESRRGLEEALTGASRGAG